MIQHPRARRAAGSTILLLMLAIPGCAEQDKPTAAATGDQTAASPSSAPTPITSKPVELDRLGGGATRSNKPMAAIYPGSGQFYNAAVPSQKGVVPSGDGDISLNFVNADVKEAAKGVLGDLLGMNYLVDPAVQGTVTIQTNQPLPRKAVLPAFETALRVSGLALVQQAGLYSIVPFGAAGHLGGSGSAEAGYGTEIVQLRYVSPEQMRRVLEPMVPQGTIVQVDQARDLIVIGGTEGERAAIKENIASFDVNWLRGMSFALFTPRVATAKQMADDLTHVMGDEGSPIAGQVRLIPIERMNAVLAISPQTKYLEELRVWVSRLDQGNETTDRRIFVYQVQNGRAADLANVLGKALSIRTSSVSGESSRGNGGSSQAAGGLAQPSGFSIGQNQGITGQNSGLSGSFGSGPQSALPGNQFASTPSANRTPTVDSSTNNTGNDQQSSGLSITADEVNNALLVVATSSEFQTIEAALRKLDVLPLQVLIEAAIAEVTLTNDLRFGVQWLFNNDTHNVRLSGANNGSILPNFPGFSYVYTSGQRITAVLSALEGVTHVDVLSSPKLMVLNNQTAVLQVGDQVPIATQSAVSTVTPGAPVVNSIEYKDTGVILTVTPRVNEGGLVLMDISQEVSNVTPTTTSSLNSPTINQRKIGSTVAIQDGQTIALGGLITDNRTRGRSGIPLLQDIPVLGHLFSQDSNNDTRTELLVLITPRVVRDGRSAAAVTAELRDKLTGLKDSPALLPAKPIN